MCDFREICETAQEEFYAANGYYPTPKEAVKLTDEARKEIDNEKRMEILLETDKKMGLNQTNNIAVS